jgi:hypothetical protein
VGSRLVSRGWLGFHPKRRSPAQGRANGLVEIAEKDEDAATIGRCVLNPVNVPRWKNVTTAEKTPETAPSS